MSSPAAAAADGVGSRGDRARHLTEFVFRLRELGIVGAFVLLMVVTSVIEPRFLNSDSLRNLGSERRDLRDPRGWPDARPDHAQR